MLIQLGDVQQSLKLIFLFRYYRANSVRYPTPPCEGVCALNHYCAITRVDYREFRQCLETAASALASSSKSSSSSITHYLTLILTIFVTFKCDQRKLLFDWLHFLFDANISIMKLILMLPSLMCLIIRNIFSKIIFNRTHFSLLIDHRKSNSIWCEKWRWWLMCVRIALIKTTNLFKLIFNFGKSYCRRRCGQNMTRTFTAHLIAFTFNLVKPSFTTASTTTTNNSNCQSNLTKVGSFNTMHKYGHEYRNCSRKNK